MRNQPIPALSVTTPCASSDIFPALPPIPSLHSPPAALASAISAERYEEAAQLKSQLKALEAELGAAALDSGLLNTRSDVATRGVRVVVQSAYVPQVGERRWYRGVWAG